MATDGVGGATDATRGGDGGDAVTTWKAGGNHGNSTAGVRGTNQVYSRAIQATAGGGGRGGTTGGNGGQTTVGGGPAGNAGFSVALGEWDPALDVVPDEIGHPPVQMHAAPGLAVIAVLLVLVLSAWQRRPKRL